MDWSKAKARLIIILLILNISLLVLYYVRLNGTTIYSASEATLGDLERRLVDYGIGFDASLPKSPERVKPLIVEYEKLSPDEINDRFFDGQGKIERSPDLYKITMGEEEVTIINHRRLLYENGVDQEEKSFKSPEAVAKKFLADRGFSGEDLVLVNSAQADESMVFEFTKKYKNKLLETSYTRVIVINGMVETMDRLWIDVIEEDVRALEIEPAYKALFSLIGKDELKGLTVNSVELCYYFNPEEQGILEDNLRAERGRAIPGWRIAFENGITLIVDNY